MIKHFDELAEDDRISKPTSKQMSVYATLDTILNRMLIILKCINDLNYLYIILTPEFLITAKDEEYKGRPDI